MKRSSRRASSSWRTCLSDPSHCHEAFLICFKNTNQSQCIRSVIRLAVQVDEAVRTRGFAMSELWESVSYKQIIRFHGRRREVSEDISEEKIERLMKRFKEMSDRYGESTMKLISEGWGLLENKDMMNNREKFENLKRSLDYLRESREKFGDDAIPLALEEFKSIIEEMEEK